MTRQVMRVDGVSTEVKEQLRSSAQKILGKPNASLLVRQLITEHLEKNNETPIAKRAIIKQGEPEKSIELRLPVSIIDRLSEISDNRMSSRNYLLTYIILDYLDNHQLLGDEIEVLRRSNYELSKIGSNLNQITKAFNIIVKMGDGKIPEIGKKIESLRKSINEHTRKVLHVLESKTIIWENNDLKRVRKHTKQKRK